MTETFNLIERVTFILFIAIALTLGWLLQAVGQLNFVVLPLMGVILLGFGRKKYPLNLTLQNGSFFFLLLSIAVVTASKTGHAVLLTILTVASISTWVWQLLWTRLHTYDLTDEGSQKRITHLLTRRLYATIALFIGTMLFLQATQIATISLQFWPTIMVSTLIIALLLRALHILRRSNTA